MIKVLSILGARPQIIKSAAISRVIKKSYSDKIEDMILHTGQHYDENMSETFFQEMQIPDPVGNLNVGSNQSAEQMPKMISGIDDFLKKEQPDCVILYGDTNSTLAGSVAANLRNIPILHVEAGLRSFNKFMPEENNRIVCDHLSTLLFCPTKNAVDNLAKEGLKHSHGRGFTVNSPGIFHCGDIMYDNSLFYLEAALKKSKIISDLKINASAYILVTIHRDYNTDDQRRLQDILLALTQFKKTIEKEIVFPIHPRTIKNIKSNIDPEIRDDFFEEIKVIEPVSFFDMINLEYHSKMIITDSGGVQKEAYFYKKHVLILRTETEWIEIIQAEAGALVEPDFKSIHDAYNYFIKNIPQFDPIFGEGNTANFICNRIVDTFK